VAGTPAVDEVARIEEVDDVWPVSQADHGIRPRSRAAVVQRLQL